MTTFLLFAAILAGVVLIGGWWMLRSARQEPRDEAALDESEPVVVAGPGAHMEIEVIRSRLEAAGLAAYARNRDGPAMPGGVAPQLFGWEVLVRRGDVEAAGEILAGEVAELPSPEPRV